MAVLEHVREQLPGDNLIIVSWGKDPRKVKKEQVEAGVEERTPKFFSVGGTIILDSDDDEEQPIATLVDESNGRARFETARTPAPVILPCLPSGAHGPRTKYVLVAIGLRGAAWEASVISVASSPCVDLFGPTGASRGHAFWRTRHGDRCARGKPGSGAHGPRTKYVLVAIGLRGAAWEASVISVQHFCNTCPQRSASSGGSRSLERGRGASGRGASSGSC